MKPTFSNFLLLSTVSVAMLSIGCTASMAEKTEQAEAPTSKNEGSIMPDYPEAVTTCYGSANTAIELTLFEDKVTGFYGVMNGGELAGHGGYASLNGTRYDRRIDVEGTFEIEGSRQVEDMAFVLHRDDTLSQGSGEYIDQKGGKTVFKDPKNLTWGKPYEQISCSGNKLLDVAREVYGKASAK